MQVAKFDLLQSNRNRPAEHWIYISSRIRLDYRLALQAKRWGASWELHLR